MKYNIIAKNRFTGKIYETHVNKGIGAVYEVQDVYMLLPWVKVEVIEVEELEE